MCCGPSASLPPAAPPLARARTRRVAQTAPPGGRRVTAPSGYDWPGGTVQIEVSNPKLRIDEVVPYVLYQVNSWATLEQCAAPWPARHSPRTR